MPPTNDKLIKKADTCVSLAIHQQGKQTVDGVGCYLLISSGALCRRFTSLISLMLNRCVPMVFQAVLVSSSRVFPSWAVHIPCQFVMFPIKMLSIAPL